MLDYETEFDKLRCKKSGLGMCLTLWNLVSRWLPFLLSTIDYFQFLIQNDGFVRLKTLKPHPSRLGTN